MARTKKKKSKNRDKLVAGGLREISPGVLVGPNYKPGKDPALDKVIETLKKDPASIDYRRGQHYKI